MGTLSSCRGESWGQLSQLSALRGSSWTNNKPQVYVAIGRLVAQRKQVSLLDKKVQSESKFKDAVTLSSSQWSAGM